MHNAFEHVLREHVQNAYELWEYSVREDGKSTPSLYVTFNNDAWTVVCHLPNIVTSGAELMLVMEEHINTYHTHRRLRKLRSKESAASNDNH